MHYIPSTPTIVLWQHIWWVNLQSKKSQSDSSQSLAWNCPEKLEKYFVGWCLFVFLSGQYVGCQPSKPGWRSAQDVHPSPKIVNSQWVWGTNNLRIPWCILIFPVGKIWKNMETKHCHFGSFRNSVLHFWTNQHRSRWHDSFQSSIWPPWAPAAER